MGKRIEWLDTAKGYGIIFVIIGHLGFPYITDYLYTFHIPLFFFLSGYVYKDTSNTKEFLSAKIRKIVLPYLYLVTPMIIIPFLLHFDFQYFIDNILQFIIQKRHTPMWFLSCLFILNILLYAIFYFIKDTKKRILTFFLVSILGCFYFRYIHVCLPWNVDAAFVSLPFFAAGFFAKKSLRFKNMVEHKHSLLLSLFMGGNIICGAINYFYSDTSVDIYRSILGFEPLFYISAFSGLIFMIFLSNRLTNIGLKYIGSNSLLYFAWHQTLIFPFLFKILNQLPFNINSLLEKFIVLILTIIILTILNEIICRSKLRFILGR